MADIDQIINIIRRQHEEFEAFRHEQQCTMQSCYDDLIDTLQEVKSNAENGIESWCPSDLSTDDFLNAANTLAKTGDVAEAFEALVDELSNLEE